MCYRLVMRAVRSSDMVFGMTYNVLSGMPLIPKGAKALPPPSERTPITNETIYNCIAAPSPTSISTILDTLLSTSDISSCLSTVNALKTSYGLALADILSSLSEELAKLEVPPRTRITWLQGLADIEYRLAGGGSELVQTGGMVGVVRQGVDLMDKA
jgi:replication factor C subunit 3/5